ncbi:MAG: hypothetical protein CM15mP77_1210 [Synechococcus sp.]|nr:MAG: hypothetical protein CM15mP77_1210 [Synechococcus sp.]
MTPSLSVPSAGRRCESSRATRRSWPSRVQLSADKGNVGTAAYLDVFGSIHRVMQEMKAKGYDVQNLPSTPRACSKPSSMTPMPCRVPELPSPTG